MTQEKFKKAKDLEERIKRLTLIIEELSKYDYKLEHPTRISNFTLYRLNEPHMNLNEGEVVVIQKALEAERDRLHQDFERL